MLSCCSARETEAQREVGGAWPRTWGKKGLLQTQGSGLRALRGSFPGLTQKAAGSPLQTDFLIWAQSRRYREPLFFMQLIVAGQEGSKRQKPGRVLRSEGMTLGQA